MKYVYLSLYFFIKVIASLVFVAGLSFTGLGLYEFIHSLSLVQDDENAAVSMAVFILKTIDMFLIAIVCFIFSLGLMVLFDNKKHISTSLNLPEWLNVKNFMQLKVILWEAVLTTLVISYLAMLARERFNNSPLTPELLIIPGAIFLISISLFALKKSEKE